MNVFTLTVSSVATGGAAGTDRRDFTDISDLDMRRCPMRSCGYSVANSRNNSRTHCSTYHKTAITYTYHFAVNTTSKKVFFYRQQKHLEEKVEVRESQ